MKFCSKCDTLKDVSLFYKSKITADGLSCYCKSCAYSATRKYIEKHRVSYLKNRMEYRVRNKAKIAEYNAEYNIRNKDKIRVYKNEYEKARRKVDPIYKLIKNIRARLRSAIRAAKCKKTGSIHSLLGCTDEELRCHIESKFTVGMSWEKVGNEIHIDHIKPICSFNLYDLEQYKACFHYTNLQPLWARDNLRKGCKY